MSRIVNRYTYQATENIAALITDREYAKRYFSLKKLFKAFTENNIKWAVSCSLGLFLQGIVDNFHDFDVIVAPECFETASAVLSDVGHKKTFDKDPSRNGYFRSKNFAEFEIDGIDIDLICEFGVIYSDCFYQYHFSQGDLQFANVGNMPIPFVPAEAQFLLYSMMVGWQPQRAFKRDLLKSYLKSGNITKPNVLIDSARDLPYWIKEDIWEIIR